MELKRSMAFFISQRKAVLKKIIYFFTKDKKLLI